ncbi:unnamed protein product [Rhodiola kirilowii]
MLLFVCMFLCDMASGWFKCESLSTPVMSTPVKVFGLLDT